MVAGYDLRIFIKESDLERLRFKFFYVLGYPTGNLCGGSSAQIMLNDILGNKDCFLFFQQMRIFRDVTYSRLNNYFESMVEIPRIKVGSKQTIETLISEEALLLAKCLRDENGDWAPRIAIPIYS